MTVVSAQDRLAAAGWNRTLEVRGALAVGPAVAIVGARAATTTGMQRASHLAAHAASRGIDVVSGGALGIDGAAHRGALAAGGRTTVVLGSGLDVPYPRRHAPLFARAVAAGGALVSMFPAHLQPRPSTFPARNPLIAALADAVIVVEADVQSGSLSTAHAARKLGRIVAAWPGSPGCDQLLGAGAAIVEGAADLDALADGHPRMPSPRVLDPIAHPNAARVAAARAVGARDVDAIVARTGLSVREVLRALFDLDSLEAASPAPRTP